MPLANAATTAATSGPPPTSDLLSLVVYAGLAVVMIGALMCISWLLGHKSRGGLKEDPYESGVAPTGQARLREPVPFYLVAIFFIVFDVEAIFIVSWAVAWDRLGWAGYLQITFFIIILLFGLIYLWKMGGLDWGPRAWYRQRDKRKGA
ncbi:NADH-quinone oxidoreductase subunit A [Geothermobacter hydrogeniphilus]|uniref:NADH-quinone oxidoreductase subunit A n=1 Tax=Geothermobacter hydrogeniphilus TaxID=1969733 RepID=A0A2K2HEL6_9BACT|nr:NADH-quinone oxidoreductase subunit A [Geothermobacter hydrogeniphilus]PNU21742.1 NADH-quinone oxidoreductase subunit A [Geothermobacter hydrogeniphilus]